MGRDYRWPPCRGQPRAGGDGGGLPSGEARHVLQWSNADQPWVSATPTLFDVVPVAALLAPARCPLTPLRIEIGPRGQTLERPGPPNARVCLAVDRAGLLDDLMQALLR